MVLNVHTNHTHPRLIRDGEKGGGGRGYGLRRGKGESIYLSLHCHHHNDLH